MKIETATAKMPGALEIIGLLAMTGVVLVGHVPLSSDGVVYLRWYSMLSEPSGPICNGFEPVFCVVSLVLKLVGLPSQIFLKFWSLLIYLLCYFAVRQMVYVSWMRQSLPIVFLAVALYVYLPLTITEHLTRQYVAGAIIALGLGSERRYALVVAVLAAGLFHAFCFMFLPIALVLSFGTKVGGIALLVGALAALFVDFNVDTLNLLSWLFEQIRLLGEAWGIDYFKSLFYRFNIYWIGFSKPFGYPEVSFRGIRMVLVAFVFLYWGDRRAIHIVIFMGFIALLWFVFRSNDLIAHRVYHYIREIAILPAVLIIVRAAQLLYPVVVRHFLRDSSNEKT